MSLIDSSRQVSSSDPDHFRPKEDKDWATLAQLGGCIGPLPPYIIHKYLGKYGEFTEDESREAVDFSFPMFALVLLFLALSNIPGDLGQIFKWIGVVIWGILIFFCIKAGLTNNKGKPYRYPINFAKFWRILTGRQKRVVLTPEQIAAEKAQKEAIAEKKAEKKAAAKKIKQERIEAKQKARAERDKIRKAKEAEARKRREAQKAAAAEAKAKAEAQKQAEKEARDAEKAAQEAEAAKRAQEHAAALDQDGALASESSASAPKRLNKPATPPQVPSAPTAPPVPKAAPEKTVTSPATGDDEEAPLPSRRDLRNK